jgi:hypothetical protein
MTKRLSINVDESIDDIRAFIQKQTGVRMTYVQVFDHLIDFYVKHANEPRTKWAPIFSVRLGEKNDD